MGNYKINMRYFNDYFTMMADGVGFEPTKGFHPCRFSRPVLSTAQPPIH